MRDQTAHKPLMIDFVREYLQDAGISQEMFAKVLRLDARTFRMRLKRNLFSEAEVTEIARLANVPASSVLGRYEFVRLERQTRPARTTPVLIRELMQIRLEDYTRFSDGGLVEIVNALYGSLGK